MDGKYILESVERVMNVLDSFTTETPELRLTDLSKLHGISKPQVLRIVTTLEHGGYLVRDPETKRYRLGLRLFVLGMIVRQQIDLQRAAQPALRMLADKTHETVGLFAPDHLGPVCLDVIESPKGLRVFAQQGRRMPWNAGSSGKVILAFLPEKEREGILLQGGFKRYTKATITDPNRLRDLLTRIREDGYHVGSRDLDEGAVGIAAPIFDHGDCIAGAISISGPVSRIVGQSELAYINLVRDVCDEVSKQLGYTGTISIQR